MKQVNIVEMRKTIDSLPPTLEKCLAKAKRNIISSTDQKLKAMQDRASQQVAELKNGLAEIKAELKEI